MKKTFYFLATLTLGFTACSKKDKVEATANPVDPVATATMTRTLDFTILGTEKDTTYTNIETIKTSAFFGNDAIIMGTEKDVFLMTIDAGPTTTTTDGAGDLVQFVIEPAKLRSDYIGTYRFDPQADLPVKHIHYAYTTNKVNGLYSMKIAGTNWGNQLTGELNITHYDATHNTISGTYSIAGKLSFDPTATSSATRLDDDCDLTVSGTFTNVKIKRN